MTTKCDHPCCPIAANGYHRHTQPPATCRQCNAVAVAVAAAPGATTTETSVLARIVADVVVRVAPEIPGLPAGAELAELVAGHALAAYAAGLVDPDLQSLDPYERRIVLAGRVGLALAFPAAP